MVILDIGHLIREELANNLLMKTNALATYKECMLYLIQPPLRVLCEICGY